MTTVETTQPRAATFADFQHWLTRHGHDVKTIAQDPITVHIGREDDLTYLQFRRYVETVDGRRQIDRTTGVVLTESVMVPFDLIPGESADR